MAFDDLAFRSSLPVELQKGWCPRCFAVWEVAESDMTCPSCWGSLRRISPEDADRARTMVNRVNSLMASRSGTEGAALVGPLGEALMGLGELAGIGAPAAPSGGADGSTFAEGDAVSDEELPSLLERMMEEFGGAKGNPAASKDAIDALTTFEIVDDSSLPREIALQVTGIPGQIVTIPASFGPTVPERGISGALCVVDPLLVDGEIVNAADVVGKIAIVKRGKVDFATKARRVQAAGAVALLVTQDRSVWPYTMQDSKTNGEGVEIPVVMVDQEHGEKLQSILALRAKEARGVLADESGSGAGGELEKAGSTSTDVHDAAAQLRAYRKEQAMRHSLALARASSEGKGGEDVPEAELAAHRGGSWAKLLSKASNTTCVVCQCDYEAGETAVQMPCQHLYHKECLLEWLKGHNSCCICRLELKTDDKEYEARKRRAAEEEDGTAQWSSWFL